MGSATASEAYVDEKGGSVTSGSESGLSQAVFDASSAVLQFGSENYPDTFGGVSLGDEKNQDVLVVYLVPDASAEVSKALTEYSGLPQEQITFRQSDTTWAETNRINESIRSDYEYLRGNGVPLVEWGIGGERNGVVMTLATDSLNRGEFSTAEDIVRERYGESVVVEASSEESMNYGGRESDSPAWYGGDFIDGPKGVCTNGFAVRWPTGNTRYTLTAGHCGNVGGTFYNGFSIPSTGYSAGGYSTIGSISNQSFEEQYSIDAALIAAPGNRNVWSGGTVTNTLLRIDNFAANVTRGMPLCADGAFEGQRCGGTVEITNVCRALAGSQTNCGLVKATSSDNQFAGEGDSGGPVFLTTGGQTYGLGIIVGGTGPFYRCNNWSAQGRQDACSSTMYFTDINAILSKWGLAKDW